LGWPATNREVGNPRIGIRIGFFHQTAKRTKSTFKKAPQEEFVKAIKIDFKGPGPFKKVNNFAVF
jgi:hypothetical protein